MPQTMPMNWLTLFFMFIFIFFILNIKIYFCNQKYPINMNKLNNKLMIWKW